MRLKEPSVCKIRKTLIFEEPVLATAAVSGDWHISPIVSEGQLEMLKKAFSKIRPELIVLQGDLMDSPAEFQNPESVRKLRRWFSTCREFAPTVMVLGSHDYIEPRAGGVVDERALPRWKKICEETGVELLNDRWFETEHIRIFGIFQGPEYCRTLDGRHENNPEVFERRLVELGGRLKTDTKKANWLVAHAPDMTKRAREIIAAQFDIASFGHTHGGCLPLGVDTVVDKVGRHGGIVSPTLRPFPSNVRGVKRFRGLVEIINSGMVATQYCAPKATQYLNFAKAAEVNFVKIGTRKLD
ncbi:metallophosphoesterase [Candidatus Saccharibacteria bacterium]|nr:metallophosphoesterase [Candidatus Saccharibacteria bacterium]